MNDEEDSVMTKLRRRMVEDMNLAGLSEGTQRVYLRAVSLLVERYHAAPDRITEEEVRQYLIDLRDREGLALGTFLPRYYGLRFFYFRSLGWDWALFTKKKWRSRVRSGYLVRTAMRSADVFWMRSGIEGIAFAFR
jgi:hypothetical protein